MPKLIIIDTFEKFVTEAPGALRTFPSNWRQGQGLFNLLDHVRPDLADMIRGSDFDPFHRDERIPDFYDFLARHWD